jgi:hypothetical protein
MGSGHLNALAVELLFAGRLPSYLQDLNSLSLILNMPWDLSVRTRLMRGSAVLSQIQSMSSVMPSKRS